MTSHYGRQHPAVDKSRRITVMAVYQIDPSCGCVPNDIQDATTCSSFWQREKIVVIG